MSYAERHTEQSDAVNFETQRPIRNEELAPLEVGNLTEEDWHLVGQQHLAGRSITERRNMFRVSHLLGKTRDLVRARTKLLFVTRDPSHEGYDMQGQLLVYAAHHFDLKGRSDIDKTDHAHRNHNVLPIGP